MLILALTNQIFTDVRLNFKMSKTDSFQSPVRIKRAATSLCQKDPASNLLVKFCQRVK